MQFGSFDGSGDGEFASISLAEIFVVFAIHGDFSMEQSRLTSKSKVFNGQLPRM